MCLSAQRSIPHAPQFKTSLSVPRQTPLQRVAPALQATPHCEAEHVAKPLAMPGQTRPHAPQLFGSLAQLVHWPATEQNPELHPMPQAEALQVANPFAVPGHEWPQVAQLFASRVVSKHAPLQLVKPVRHCQEHEELTQVGTALRTVVEHALPQTEQLLGSDASDEQPPKQQASPG
jgi:hypothetical protein